MNFEQVADSVELTLVFRSTMTTLLKNRSRDTALKQAVVGCSNKLETNHGEKMQFIRVRTRADRRSSGWELGTYGNVVPRYSSFALQRFEALILPPKN